MVVRKVKVKLIRPYTKTEWYSNPEHFRTELSYSEYKEQYRKKYGKFGKAETPMRTKRRKPISYGVFGRMPSLKW